MKVHIPTPLRSYTSERDEVEIDGKTLGDLLRELDRRFPGIKFRIVNEQGSLRQHIKIFVNQAEQGDLAARLGPDDDVFILCALSGGGGDGC